MLLFGRGIECNASVESKLTVQAVRVYEQEPTIQREYSLRRFAAFNTQGGRGGSQEHHINNDKTQQGKSDNKQSERTGPITRVYRLLPDLRIQIDQAEAYLRGVKDKQINPQEVKNPALADPEVAGKLKLAYPDLDNKTPLQVIREQIEEETRSVQLPQVEPLSQSEQAMNRRIRKSISRRSDPDIPIISDVTHIEEYHPASTQAIHLAHSSVITLQTLRTLIERLPNLRIIEIPPSYKHLIRQSYKELLKTSGIELRVQRTRDEEHYDITPETAEYKSKKGLFEALFTRNDTKDVVECMQRNEIMEFEIAQRYYGNERLSMVKIAEKLGVPLHFVQRKTQVITHFAGYPTDSILVKTWVETFKQRLARLQEMELNEERRDTYRRSLAVGDAFPPLSLITSQWENWQKVHQLRQLQPELFDNLRISDPRAYTMVIEYYGFSEEQVKRKTLRELGKEKEISYERVRQLVNRGLTKLGLLED